MSEFYGLEVEGPFIVEIVSSVPSYTTDDQGRLLYNESDNQLYYADHEKWTTAGGVQTIEEARDPDAEDDINKNHSVGNSIWINTNTEDFSICVRNTALQARWRDRDGTLHGS